VEDPSSPVAQDEDEVEIKKPKMIYHIWTIEEDEFKSTQERNQKLSLTIIQATMILYEDHWERWIKSF